MLFISLLCDSPEALLQANLSRCVQMASEVITHQLRHVVLLPPRSVEQVLPSGKVPAGWLCVEDRLEGAPRWLLPADCNAVHACSNSLASVQT